MKRASSVRRILAVVLVLLAGAGGFWATVLTISRWDDIWLGNRYYNSSTCMGQMSDYAYTAQRVASLLQSKKWEGKLSYLNQQELDALLHSLEAEQTNFRFQLVNNATGALFYSNLPSGSLSIDQYVHDVHYRNFTLTRVLQDSGNDYQTWDPENEQPLIHITQPNWVVLTCSPQEQQQARRYGWILSGGTEWAYSQELDSRVQTVDLALAYGITDALEVDDEFLSGYRQYTRFANTLPYIAALAVVLDAVTVWALVFLCRNAGYRKGRDTVTLRWFDRLPLEIPLVGLFFLLMAGFNLGEHVAYALSTQTYRAATGNAMGVLSILMVGCTLPVILTVAVRVKTKTLVKNTLLWHLWNWSFRFGRRTRDHWKQFFSSLPMVWRTVGLFVLYLIGTLLTTPTVVFVPVYQGAVLYVLCKWAMQWRNIQEGTARIVGGDPSCKIDTRHMFRDLRTHAEQLNDLGGAISSAVEEQLRSEHFKAELITNVSHDLKTPLTSIINYVDLLKKLNLPEPEAAEYIAVLDRKSQRLKKLTEDLVEASKASTGNLAVNPERLGMVQLVQQALGEFEEKFRSAGLKLVSTFPSEEIHVWADGRHLWRILENLLSNCNKYALPGTRVYLDVTRWEGMAILSVKNISRQQLNIPADQLMERFVRGEESRTTEGSGLGLSIARSLTELQNGTFRLNIDGDLFKATVTLPEAANAGLPELRL